MDTLCVKVYSNNQTGHCFAVGFGQFFGMDWIHVVSQEYGLWDSMEYAQDACEKMLARAPKHLESLEEVCFKAWVCIMQTRLRQFTLRTCAIWKSQTESRVKLEVFLDPGFHYISESWTGFDVCVGGSPLCLHNTLASALTLPFTARFASQFHI